MNQQSPRIPPLSTDDFTLEQKELVGDWDTLNFSRVIVQSPEVYRTFVPFIDKLIRKTKLPPRDREVLVLRTLGLCNESYEFHHHVLIARNAGMSDSEIEAAYTGSEGLSPGETLLTTAAQELVFDKRVSNDTWSSLEITYSPAQMMEIVFLVGCYVVMAMATKSFDIPLENESGSIDRLTELRKYT